MNRTYLRLEASGGNASGEGLFLSPEQEKRKRGTAREDNQLNI